MTATVNLLLSDGWRYGEKKSIEVPILDDAGAPVDMDGINVRVVFLAHGRVLLEKTTPTEVTIEGASDNLVTTHLETTDYGANGIPAPGVYRVEGWDDDADVQLWEGDWHCGLGEPA